ncbi:hypothetical protein DP116_17375 [Brasilonema bromeliae SPC951]|uniref:Uncharacterized protein n=1 Tax=Brasilonema bromeliae SPC951 TaxID=385972 RepID=A0ABX1PC22_9CYAN|nr:hypothetical protein [Brasilonema bromeliae SPC951]
MSASKRYAQSARNHANAHATRTQLIIKRTAKTSQRRAGVPPVEATGVAKNAKEEKENIKVEF